MWQARHGKNVAELRKRGAPIPKHMEAPEEMPGIAPWFYAFWELSTDRAYVGGPIPSSSISAWPVAEAERETFRQCIRAADAAYLDHISHADEAPKGVATPSAVKGKKK